MKSLDHYLKEQAGQDLKRHLAAVFVLIDEETDVVAGYYTLSALAINPLELSEALRKKLPRYDAYPATLLGRLAVDASYKGKSLGKWLLVDACVRSFTQSVEVGSLAVVVDAIDESAAEFYAHFGFEKFPDQPRRLFLPMKTIGKLLNSA